MTPFTVVLLLISLGAFALYVNYLHVGDTSRQAAKSSLIFFCWATAILLAVSAIVVVVTNYEEGICAEEASGYRLEYDWSIRNGCRVYLPSGHLVPIGNIRITSDGQIISDGEE